MHLRAWTQYDLSRYSTVSQMTISNALAGKPVHPLTALKLAESFKHNPVVLDGWLATEEQSA